MSPDPKQSVGRYMDMTHPAHVRPPATSKPVIVGNRPMLAGDPMIAESAERAATVRQPDQAAPVSSTEPQFRNKVIEPPVGAAAAPELAHEHATTPDSESAADAATPESTEASVAAEDGDRNAEQSKHDPTSKTAEAPKDGTEPKEPHTVSTSLAVAPNINATTDSDEDTESEAQTAEEEAAARHEQYIAEGTYFLPIGQTKHRNQRIVFGICLIVVFAIVIVDLLLDIGLISLSNIPHTTFFGS